ncbi:glycosyltransferase family 4 protein [Citreimonas sp.]|uniref:glycosyltransferase family 4 protein n=1 Tax=Citreimonas sp. TaxID=3036715 RepID=UPI0035C84819
MAPIKVLFPYVGDSVGGSHVSSLILAQALPVDRYAPVVATHETGPLTGYFDSLGVHPVPAPAVPYVEGGAMMRALRGLRATRVLARFLRRHGIGLVHTHDMRMHMTWGAAARHAGVPHVWHQRTPARADKHARAALKADALVAVSTYCAETFPPAMRDATRVIYNPFAVPPLPDRTAARAALNATLGLPATARPVLFVGNFAPRKRPQRFVALADALARQGHDDLRFLMLGDPRPPEGDAVRAAIEAAGLGERCLVLGARHPVEPWLAGSELLVAPAVDEAFGRTLVEAQLLGTPVIASDAGGHREIVEHDATGLLVDADDGPGFSRAAAALLADDDRVRRLSDAARRAAETRFGLHAHVDQMIDVYDRAARAG